NTNFVDRSPKATALFCSKKCRTKNWYMANKEHAIEVSHKYEAQNKEKIKVRKNQYMKDRRATDINFRLACNIRARISRAMANNFKESSLSEYLGCTVSELKT